VLETEDWYEPGAYYAETESESLPILRTSGFAGAPGSIAFPHETELLIRSHTSSASGALGNSIQGSCGLRSMR
jgi:hypothetical protein